MENKELQEVVEAITDAILAMEERINKRFDKVENGLESLEEEVKGIRLDINIIEAKIKKQEFDISRIKNAM